MSILRKSDPTGIDKLIDQWQVAIYNGLVVNGTWSKYESYHRGYRDEIKGVTEPRYFTTNSDYITVTMNDNFCVTSFFVVKPKRSFDGEYRVATVSMIFQADIAKLYPASPHRFDEELINDVIGIMDRDLNPFFTRGDIVTGIDDVYEDFDTESIKKLKHDMQPYNVARFDMEIRYSHNRCDTYAVSGIVCTVGVTVDVTDESVPLAADGTATSNVTGESASENLSYSWTTIDGVIPSGQEENANLIGLVGGTYTVTVVDDVKDECNAINSGTVETGEPVFDFGNALTLDGINDAASISILSGVDNDDFTFNMWAKSAVSGNVLVSNLSSTFIFFNTTTTASIKVGNTTTTSFVIPTFTSLWRMYTLTRISGVLHFYVNSVESITGGVTRAGKFELISIGGHASPLKWAGEFTEGYVNLGTGATQSMIDATYNSRLGADPTVTIGAATAYWKYNESGTDTVVIDETGNFNQSMSNFPVFGMWNPANVI